MAAVLDVFGRGLCDHVVNAVAKLNRSDDGLVIRGYGGNIASCVETAWILERELDLKIMDTAVKGFDMLISEGPRCEIVIPGVEVTVQRDSGWEEGKEEIYSENGYVDFPAWFLLLDNWLKGGRIFVKDEKDGKTLVEIKEQGGRLQCVNRTSRGSREGEWVKGALYRSGLLMPENWKEIAGKLSAEDDIVIGVDTNILLNCTITRHLIPALSIIDPKEYIHTPNWLMFVIPYAVIHELEEAANVRSENRLRHAGRMGFRALQEIIELSRRMDLEGISVFIAGEANPVLDTRVELQGLRLDFRNGRREGGRGDKISGGGRGKRWSGQAEGQPERLVKSSSGDMIIRDQFKRFLAQMSFHKGSYFITADKSNAILAKAEGLHSVYVKFPSRIYFHADTVGESEIGGAKGSSLGRGTTVGDVVYEMAVEFGKLYVADGKGKVVGLECDMKGETHDCWVYKKLKISDADFELLKNGYSGFALAKICRLWEKLVGRLSGMDEL